MADATFLGNSWIIYAEAQRTKGNEKYQRCEP